MAGLCIDQWDINSLAYSSDTPPASIACKDPSLIQFKSSENSRSSCLPNLYSTASQKCLLLIYFSSYIQCRVHIISRVVNAVSSKHPFILTCIQTLLHAFSATYYLALSFHHISSFPTRILVLKKTPNTLLSQQFSQLHTNQYTDKNKQLTS